MPEITKQELLDLSDSYIRDWHDVQTHYSLLIDDGSDAGVEVHEYVGTWSEDYRNSLGNILISPFVQLIGTEYCRELDYILKQLNGPHGTYTSLNPEHTDTLGELPNDIQFRLGVIYAIAAGIVVCSDPERYSHDAVAQGILQAVTPNKEVIKYAQALADAVSRQKGLEIGDLFSNIVELANGRVHDKILVPVTKDTERVVTEITLLSNHVFINSNKRRQGRFSTSAIERILEMLNLMGCLDKVIGYKQISNIQRKLENNDSDPLTFNPDNIPWIDSE